VADDEREQFELVYRQNFRAVLRYALARVEPEAARDAAAETFLIAWRRFGEVPAEPAAWLFGVARKVIAGQLRSDARREALRDRLVLTWNHDAQADPAEQVALRDSALSALARLGEFDREVLKLVAWDGLPAGVAAEMLGMSRLNFAVRLHRARRRLAAALVGAGPRLPPRQPPPLQQARREQLPGQQHARSHVMAGSRPEAIPGLQTPPASARKAHR
jgi:RNA polymerase sigma-70 factor, ECF subfamily